MKGYIAFAAILAALLFCSCNKIPSETAPQPANRPATVTLQDGTKVDGDIVKSSEKEILLIGKDKITRTIPMDQVQNIDYGNAAAAPADNKASVESKTQPVQAGSVENKAQPVQTKPIENKAQPVQTKPIENKAQPVKSKLVESKDQPAQTKPVQTIVYEVPAGASIEVRAEETIDSAVGTAGQVFAGTVAKDVNDNAGHVTIPRGSKAEIIILSASKGGNFRGASDLELDLKSVTVHGTRLSVESEEVIQKGRQGIGANKRTAEFTGGGAALGALIGGIVGGGKGAAIGAASGAGAGAATQILTKGKAIKIPVETILRFKLERPLQITETR
jgi:hypothetical protein